MDLEKCIKGYEDGNQNATITNDTFCAGFLDKDACGVSTDQLKLSINITSVSKKQLHIYNNGNVKCVTVHK